MERRSVLVSNLVQQALLMSSVGISHIPIRVGTKAPAIRWKRRQSRVPSLEECHVFYRDQNVGGIAAVCGAVSGNLLCMDFDQPGAADEFEILCLEYGLNDLIRQTVRTETPSLGNHLWFQCSDVVPNNEKLARSMTGEVISEIRGEGGYAIIPPTPGYQLQRGYFDRMPLFHRAEVHLLLHIAALFDKYQIISPSVSKSRHSEARQHDNSNDVVNWYNSTTDYYDVLSKHGWKIESRHGKEWMWTRPGKDSGISATTNHQGKNRMYVFSTNALPLDGNRSYSPYAVLALLDYNSDWREAASALKRMRG